MPPAFGPLHILRRLFCCTKRLTVDPVPDCFLYICLTLKCLDVTVLIVISHYSCNAPLCFAHLEVQSLPVRALLFLVYYFKDSLLCFFTLSASALSTLDRRYRRQYWWPCFLRYLHFSLHNLSRTLTSPRERFNGLEIPHLLADLLRLLRCLMLPAWYHNIKW